MKNNQYVIGGFPAICLEEDLFGKGGEICGALIFDDKKWQLALQGELDDLSRHGKNVRDVEWTKELFSKYQPKLPSLFALMHFHILQLKEQKSIVVVKYRYEQATLGWFKADEDGKIFYKYFFHPNHPLSMNYVHTGYFLK